VARGPPVADTSPKPPPDTNVPDVRTTRATASAEGSATATADPVTALVDELPAADAEMGPVEPEIAPDGSADSVMDGGSAAGGDPSHASRTDGLPSATDGLVEEMADLGLDRRASDNSKWFYDGGSEHPWQLESSGRFARRFPR
jgi:hypothetical protein